MLSVDFIRKNADLVKKVAKLKNRKADVDLLLSLDEEYRALLQQINELRAERNVLARGGKNASLERGKQIKKEIKEKEEKSNSIKKQLDELIGSVPNIPYAEVPEGADEMGNQEIKRVGKPTEFSFIPRTHIELVEMNDLADFDRGAKIAGYRGYFLKNQLAVLQVAVLTYAFMKIAKKGYTPIIAPSLVKEFPFFGVGHFPWGRDEVYHLEKDDMYLSGTAEVPMTAYFADEVLIEKELPKKFVAFSPCFRREIGNYGKDTRGLYRVHEFWKVEQVILAAADDSEARVIHEELLRNSEELMEDFELPYRVLLMCTGDMGEPQAKKYDLELWLPSKKGYGEIGSNSIMTDFQSRRLKIRYKTKEGDMKYVYTFNNTAVPSPRILIALLENFQREDGSIHIPKVLQPYCGFDTIARNKK